jgi:hypothetical protein
MFDELIGKPERSVRTIRSIGSGNSAMNAATRFHLHQMRHSAVVVADAVDLGDHVDRRGGLSSHSARGRLCRTCRSCFRGGSAPRAGCCAGSCSSSRRGRCSSPAVSGRGRRISVPLPASRMDRPAARRHLVGACDARRVGRIAGRRRCGCCVCGHRCRGGRNQFRGIPLGGQNKPDPTAARTRIYASRPV